MAESGLSIGYTELQQAVGRLLGFGHTVANWSAAQTTVIQDLVQSGVRRVYYPPAYPGIPPGYEWSFLRPWTTLTTADDDYDYDLPDAYGRLIGSFHYAADEYRTPIVQISIAELLDKRSMYDESGYPNVCAVRWKAEDRTTGQRSEVLFYPEPDDEYVLSYQYEAYSGLLSDSYPYPLGGMKMSELYKESCLASAESSMKDELGIHHQEYQALLIDAVARDMKHGAKHYGRMGGGEDTFEQKFHRGYDGSTYEITYDGETI